MRCRLSLATSSFLSTPSARRATWAEADAEETRQISIHALREEGDRSASYRASPSGYFYPRPPRGGRHDPKRVGGQKDVFLSTPSARRATFSGRICVLPFSHFYPRPPRGGRPLAAGAGQGQLDISIHALREEGDMGLVPPFCTMSRFLSTPSARRATSMQTDGTGTLIFLSTPSARRATVRDKAG